MKQSYDDLFIDVEIFNLNQNKKIFKMRIYPWFLFLGFSIFRSCVPVHRLSIVLFTSVPRFLKLYCRYEYTRPYMINRIWSLKQL